MAVKYGWNRELSRRGHQLSRRGRANAADTLGRRHRVQLVADVQLALDRHAVVFESEFTTLHCTRGLVGSEFVPAGGPAGTPNRWHSVMVLAEFEAAA